MNSSDEATPEPVIHECSDLADWFGGYLCACGEASWAQTGCPVATPPAEPAAHLGGVRADNAVLDIPAQRRAPERAPITPRTPSQPVTCEHGQGCAHSYLEDDLTWVRCAGPVV